METQTVIACFWQAFTLFGLCGCVRLLCLGTSFRARIIWAYLLVNAQCIIREVMGSVRSTVMWSCLPLNLLWKRGAFQFHSRKLFCLKPCTQYDRCCVLLRIPRLINVFSNFNVAPLSVLLLRLTMLNDGAKVLVERHVRSSKFEPWVDEAEIIHATPSYAHVRLQNGREATVSLRDIAPVPGDVSSENDEQVFLHGDDPLSGQGCPWLWCVAKSTSWTVIAWQP